MSFYKIKYKFNKNIPAKIAGVPKVWVIRENLSIEFRILLSFLSKTLLSCRNISIKPESNCLNWNTNNKNKKCRKIKKIYAVLSFDKNLKNWNTNFAALNFSFSFSNSITDIVSHFLSLHWAINFAGNSVEHAFAKSFARCCASPTN